MEATLEIDAATQQQLARAAGHADNSSFVLPDTFVRAVVGPTHLGQLDVNPLGTVPGSRNDFRRWTFRGQRVACDIPDVTRIQIQGTSRVKGRQRVAGKQTDGGQWEHQVVLEWYGFIDIKADVVHKLTLLAAGDERLRWGTSSLQNTAEPEAAHLMAGHFIDQDSGVRYALTAGQISQPEL